MFTIFVIKAIFLNLGNGELHSGETAAHGCIRFANKEKSTRKNFASASVSSSETQD